MRKRLVVPIVLVAALGALVVNPAYSATGYYLVHVLSDGSVVTQGTFADLQACTAVLYANASSLKGQDWRCVTYEELQTIRARTLKRFAVYFYERRPPFAGTPPGTAGYPILPRRIDQLGTFDTMDQCKAFLVSRFDVQAYLNSLVAASPYGGEWGCAEWRTKEGP
jgi:hypothetical protein